MFYSKSTGGFYVRAIHADSIPSDAVEVTKDEHARLLKGQSEGNIISSDENGFPILKECEPQPKTPGQRIKEIESRLAELDLLSLRPLRAIEAGSATQYDHDKLKDLDAESETLRNELRGLMS